MSILLYKTIGQQLRTVRTQLELRQMDVANQIGISTTYYGRIERRESKPSIDCLVAICGALELSLQEVFQEDSSAGGTTERLLISNSEFARFFVYANDRANQETKTVLLNVCREIMSLEK